MTFDTASTQTYRTYSEGGMTIRPSNQNPTDAHSITVANADTATTDLEAFLSSGKTGNDRSASIKDTFIFDTSDNSPFSFRSIEIVSGEATFSSDKLDSSDKLELKANSPGVLNFGPSWTNLDSVSVTVSTPAQLIIDNLVWM